MMDRVTAEPPMTQPYPFDLTKPPRARDDLATTEAVWGEPIHSKKVYIAYQYGSLVSCNDRITE
jgi:hypothetical protein